MSKPKRFIVAADNHGDMQDDGAVDCFLQFMRDWKPEIRVHAGDCFDIRPFRIGASDEDKCGTMSQDVEAGVNFIRQMQPTHFLRGNHDERLWDGLDHHKADRKDLSAKYAEEILTELKKSLKHDIIPYNKRNGILKFGHLNIIHGFHAGITAAKRAAETYGNVLMGHIHAIDHYSVPKAERTMGRSIGCLCRLEQNYNRAQAGTLRQAHGWAYGLLFDDGTFRVQQAEEVNGVWHVPTSFKEYHHAT